MSFKQIGKKSKTVEIILWIVAALLIVAMVGFFISLTNHFEAEIGKGEDNADIQVPGTDNGTNENPNEGTNGSTNNGTNGGTTGDVSTPQEKWQLVFDVNDLSVGDKIIIVATAYDYALGAEQATNNRTEARITKDGNAVNITEYTQIITVEEGILEGTYSFTVGTGYLYAPSSSSNNLKTKSTLDENGSWLIQIDGEGIASIVAQGESERNTLMYNATSGIFSCYANTNSQKTVSIYKLIASASD